MNMTKRQLKQQKAEDKRKKKMRIATEWLEVSEFVKLLKKKKKDD